MHSPYGVRDACLYPVVRLEMEADGTWHPHEEAASVDVRARQRRSRGVHLCRVKRRNDGHVGDRHAAAEAGVEPRHDAVGDAIIPRREHACHNLPAVNHHPDVAEVGEERRVAALLGDHLDEPFRPRRGHVSLIDARAHCRFEQSQVLTLELPRSPADGRPDEPVDANRLADWSHLPQHSVEAAHGEDAVDPVTCCGRRGRRGPLDPAAL